MFLKLDYFWSSTKNVKSREKLILQVSYVFSLQSCWFWNEIKFDFYVIYLAEGIDTYVGIFMAAVYRAALLYTLCAPPFISDKTWLEIGMAMAGCYQPWLIARPYCCKYIGVGTYTRLGIVNHTCHRFYKFTLCQHTYKYLSFYLYMSTSCYFHWLFTLDMHRPISLLPGFRKRLNLNLESKRTISNLCCNMIFNRLVK